MKTSLSILFFEFLHCCIFGKYYLLSISVSIIQNQLLRTLFSQNMPYLLEEEIQHSK